jgi:hypothetical protein
MGLDECRGSGSQVGRTFKTNDFVSFVATDRKKPRSDFLSFVATDRKKPRSGG